MPNGSESIRAEAVGSLIRPRHLVGARRALEHATINAAEFKETEDRAVDQAIALQEAIGLDVLTDGELRRRIFTGPLTEGVEGLEHVPGATIIWYTADGPIERELSRVVTGALRLRRSSVTEEFSYARARAGRRLKVTLPSPLMLLMQWSPEHSTAAYSDAFTMTADAADIIRAEVHELARLGCTHIQIDAPEIATLVQHETRQWYEHHGISVQRILTEGLDLINSITDAPGITFGIHLCRGNRNGRWMAAGGYDAVADALFHRCPGFDRYLLEYDDERSGTFAPLTATPADKTVVLGLVSTKTATIEPIDTIIERIHQAAAHVPLEQLALSTQCGFASVVEEQSELTEDVQAAKLELVVRAAEQVWKD